MAREKEIIWLLLSWVISFAVFLILLGVANVIKNNSTNQVLIQSVNFLNTNVFSLILIGILFLIGSIFMLLMFPFDLPGPLFSATGGFMLSNFIFKIFALINSLLAEKVFDMLISLSNYVSLIIFVLVLLIGYIDILVRNFRPKREERVKDKGREKRRK